MCRPHAIINVCINIILKKKKQKIIIKYNMVAAFRTQSVKYERDKRNRSTVVAATTAADVLALTKSYYSRGIFGSYARVRLCYIIILVRSLVLYTRLLYYLQLHNVFLVPSIVYADLGWGGGGKNRGVYNFCVFILKLLLLL